MAPHHSPAGGSTPGSTLSIPIQEPIVTVSTLVPTPSTTLNVWGGRKLQNCRNTTEALQAAGLNWDVTEHPLDDPSGPVVGWKSLRRSDTGSLLAVVGQSYTPVQNRDAFSPLDAFLGDIELDHALCLKGGRRVVLTARIGLEADVTANDPVESWLVIYNSHDGSLAYGLMFTPIRVVCQNTLSWALGRQDRISQQDGVQSLENVKLHRKRVTFKHTASVSRQIEKLPELINLKARQFEGTVEDYRLLHRTPCTTDLYRRYLELVFHDALYDPKTRTKRSVNSLRAYPYLEEAFEAGIGSETSRGTLWGAYNALTQWASHERGKSPDDRIESNLFGAGATLISTAHRSALQLV